MKLWLVMIDEADWDYDRFEQAAVWAETAVQAEQIVRAVDGSKLTSLPVDPTWTLHVREAPTEGVVLVHWLRG